MKLARASDKLYLSFLWTRYYVYSNDLQAIGCLTLNRGWLANGWPTALAFLAFTAFEHNERCACRKLIGTRDRSNRGGIC